ncbi:MAG TPA: hypothetical protein VKX16_07070 [Chloroflexota bacterium]|nr:hypothetical protein [Chloroflexota bacterium]
MRLARHSVLVGVVAILLFPLPARATGGGIERQAARLTPRQIVAQYFAALNAHRYHAAWQLEASCGKVITVPNGSGSPVGLEGWAGRPPWQPPSREEMNHSILRSARVTGIRPLHIPILTRNHILAFGVSGWYTFDYSRVPWANMKHRNGFHVVKIAMWQCHGRWGVEPGAWLSGSGGELTWN